MGDTINTTDEENTDPEDGPVTMNVGGVEVDADAFMAELDSGATQEEALENLAADGADGDSGAEDDEGDEDGDGDGADDDSDGEGEGAAGGGLEAEERDRVANTLRRMGWSPDRIGAALEGPEADREFAIDQAHRFSQTQTYIEQNLRRGTADDSESNDGDTRDHPEEEEPPQRVSLDGSSSEIFERLEEEFGQETSEALRTLVETSAGQAQRRVESQVQEALAPMAQFMERAIRRETGEEYPELLESDAAWQRVCERAQSLATVSENKDPWSLVSEAAKELRYKQTERAEKTAKRRQAAANLQPVTQSNVGSVDPATADEAWELYFQALTAGNKDDATRFKAMHAQLERDGK